jgi:hypothetical protein
MKSKDKLGEKLITVLGEASEPLETKEIEENVPAETRSKIFNRLKDLRGEGPIKGKMVGSGKGTWVWWDKNAFARPNRTESKK